MSALSYHNSPAKCNPQTSDARLGRAQALLDAGAVQPTPLVGHVAAFWVRSQANPSVAYLVTLGAESCSCPDFQRHGCPHICKHLIAARFYYIRAQEAGR